MTTSSWTGDELAQINDGDVLRVSSLRSDGILCGPVVVRETVSAPLTTTPAGSASTVLRASGPTIRARRQQIPT